MSPATLQQPLRVYAGDDFSKTFTFLSASDQTPVNLTSRKLRAQWRATPDSDTAVDFGTDLSQVAVGKVTISLSALQTRDIKDGVWDLQSVMDGSGETKTLIRGTVEWRMDVTRV